MLNQLGTIAHKDSMQQINLSALSGALAGVATPTNIGAASEGAAELHKGASAKTSSLQSAVSGEITNLRQRLTFLQSQDKSYHASQNK